MLQYATHHTPTHNVYHRCDRILIIHCSDLGNYMASWVYLIYSAVRMWLRDSCVLVLIGGLREDNLFKRRYVVAWSGAVPTASESSGAQGRQQDAPHWKQTQLEWTLAQGINWKTIHFSTQKQFSFVCFRIIMRNAANDATLRSRSALSWR